MYCQLKDKFVLLKNSSYVVLDELGKIVLDGKPESNDKSSIDVSKLSGDTYHFLLLLEVTQGKMC